MLAICKLRPDHVLDYAAEELKKYLRMLLPRCGEISISYDPAATCGFRLGLLEDFGLPNEAEDPVLDDVVHVEAGPDGGILAGSNPRSVLFAVYFFLRENGCRWLFPGVDGEYIPIISRLESVSYHKMADNRYRGQCNEGAESQQAMLETIDFTPKLGLNTYMLEFDVPKVYYDWYYDHRGNDVHREPEPVSDDTVLQWKRVCETEIAKRGLQFHDMGHGWTAEAFGINSTGGWTRDDENPVPEESRKYLAMIDGERKLFNNIALNTNFCMSNAEARKKVAEYVADYARLNSHVTYLHVWLADGEMNHCTCPVCVTKTPSDWYVMLLNDIDDELTRRNLSTRVVFCSYSDTAYEPTCEHLKNPDRFTMLLGAVSRSYTTSVDHNVTKAEHTPFVLNRSGRLKTLEEYIVRAKNWRSFAPCNSFVYEYHFWKHQFYTPGVLSMAKRLHEDVKAYRANGFGGIIQDGSQRSYFPNGLNWVVYAATLFDNDTDPEAVTRDYFAHAYGDMQSLALDFLRAIDELMPHTYVEVTHKGKKNFYDPAMEPRLKEAAETARRYRQAFVPYRNMPSRVQTVAVRLLSEYAGYVERFAEALTLKSTGRDEEAKQAFLSFMDEMGKKEVTMERYYDQFMARSALLAIFNKKAISDQ